VLLATFVIHRHAPASDRQRVWSRTRATSLLGGCGAGQPRSTPPPLFANGGGDADAATDPGRSWLRHDYGTALVEGALSLQVTSGQRTPNPLPAGCSSRGNLFACARSPRVSARVASSRVAPPTAGMTSLAGRGKLCGQPSAQGVDPCGLLSSPTCLAPRVRRHTNALMKRYLHMGNTVVAPVRGRR